VSGTFLLHSRKLGRRQLIEQMMGVSSIFPTLGPCGGPRERIRCTNQNLPKACCG
jgi:hypothetical protein